MINWKYYKPKFEYKEKFQDFNWPWAGHKFFAYDLVCNIKPRSIVELGTHRGTSFFSFCQAIKDEKIQTKLFAVDTWKGDEHSGFYGEEVFKEVNQIREKYYGNLNINLLRKTFDEAVGEFQDSSIDILHIDGLHTYEAVKHDFETWLNKVKDDGIILFHDTAEKTADFGVYKLWNELKEKYRTLEFVHSHGLGVLLKNGARFENLFDFQEVWQNYYPIFAENRILEFNLNNKNNEIISLNQAVSQKDQEISFMKSSKFWKLHNWYINLKSFFTKK